jgi:hypothetical protein
MSKASLEIEDGALVAGLDFNEDGEKLLEAKVYLSEGLEEAFKREEAIEGAKVVEAKFVGTKLMIVLDTDKDGEKMLEVMIDLAEGFDEASGAFKK